VQRSSIVLRLIIGCILLFTSKVGAQTGSPLSVDYLLPKEYSIRTIRVESNTEITQKQAVILLSGLRPGDKVKIPGDDIAGAIRRLWKDKVFADVKISAEKVSSNLIDIILYVEEKPRLLKPVFTGVRKGDRDDIAGLVKWYRGEVVSDYLLKLMDYRIRDFYAEKGFLAPTISFTTTTDSTLPPNMVILNVDIDQGQRIKVAFLDIYGNSVLSTSKIRRKMRDALIEKSRIALAEDFFEFIKGEPKPSYIDSLLLHDGFLRTTAEYARNSFRVNLFTRTKYVESEWETCLKSIVQEYQSLGYRDARFIRDTVYKANGELFAELEIYEGRRYYHRNISWIGNKKYSSTRLDSLLGIRKGDVYSVENIEKRLMFNPTGLDISSLYQDEGYLFFQVEPVEIRVEGDSIDLEIRMFEGTQARIGRIIVTGNTKTSDKVILREIRCRPGDLYSRANIMRSQQALSQLGILDPQSLDIRPKPNPADGTVDIEFLVAEAPSDQIELSGGWGAGVVIGTLGLTLRNFSLRNVLKPKTWNPLPSGDGQQLSIRGQSNGPMFQAYTFSFMEPWLGGKKPISFSLSTNFSSFQFGLQDSASRLGNFSVGLTIGKQLRWPDDYFSVALGVRFHRYDAQRYNLFASSGTQFTGQSNNIAVSFTINRNSTDDFIFPRSGSIINASVEFTPPYSAISGQDFSGASLQERYSWLEYHKWKFRSSWFTPITKSKNNPLILMLRTEFGFIGEYNSQIGITPFERFFLGGDGLAGFNIDGREIIALRGYPNNSLTPGFNGTAISSVGGVIYNKHTMELRFLLSPSPQAKIWVHSFLEAGNSWDSFRNYTPFQIKRSVGVGLRFFLPMFGLLGVDYGWGLDPLPPTNTPSGGQFHFMIGQQF
jgi:outer membrane protein insertion porin family